MPTIDIHTIGAGGGSIAWVDEGGHLQVGPQSAGADPGPACYGEGRRAGDVHRRRAGRRVPRSRQLPRRTTDSAPDRPARHGDRRLARAWGWRPEQTAAGIIRISTPRSPGRSAAISDRAGLPPEGLRAARLRRRRRLRRRGRGPGARHPQVIVPPGQGALLGFRHADGRREHDFAADRGHAASRSSSRAPSTISSRDLLERSAGGRWRRRASRRQLAFAALRRRCATPARSTRSRCRVPRRRLSDGDRRRSSRALRAAHQQHYGHSMRRPRRGRHPAAAGRGRARPGPSSRATEASRGGAGARRTVAAVCTGRTEALVDVRTSTTGEARLADDTLTGPAIVGSPAPRPSSTGATGSGRRATAS